MSSGSVPSAAAPLLPRPLATVREDLQLPVRVLGCLLLAVSGLASCGDQDVASSIPAVPQPSSALRLAGHVVPLETVEIGSLVSGLVVQIACEEGQSVHAGQRCARIEGGLLQAEVQREEAGLRAAQAREAKDRIALAHAGAVLARTRELVPDGVASQEAVEADADAAAQARAQLEVDRADITRAQAALRAARLDAARADIVSPIDGIVAERRVGVGQAIVASQQAPTLFVVTSGPDRLGVDAAMTCGGEAPPAIGTPATVVVDGVSGGSLHGWLRRVGSGSRCLSSPAVRILLIEVADPDRRLVPGMHVHVTFDRGASAER